MIRRSESGKVSIPSVALGIALVGAGVATARHLGSEPPAPPPSPERNITKFDLHRHQMAISSNERGAVRLPHLEFEVDTPPTQAKKVTAWLQGADGERLQLREIKEEPSMRIFGRLGYEQPLKSPKLIVQNDGETVMEKPLGDFPAPMRAIPLVVPIDREIRLRPVSKAQATELERQYPGDAFFTIQNTSGEACPIPCHILRTDWSANAEVAFLPKGPKGTPVIGLPKGEIGRIAELDQPQMTIMNSVKDIDLEVETVLRNGQIGIRLSKPQTIYFADGARIEIDAQERMATRGKPAFGLSTFEAAGSSTFLTWAKKPFAIEPMPPTHREMGPVPELVGLNQNRMELLSPRLEDLGITRLRIGPYEVMGKKGRSLVPGKHKLRVRFTRKVMQVIDRRRFVEIES